MKPEWTVGDRLRAPFQTARFHASPFQIGSFLLMGFLGGARGWALVGFGLLGLFLHIAGWSQGAVVDLPWDKKDPSKAGHPIIDGRQTVFTVTVQVIVAEVAFWSVLLYLRPSWTVLGVFVLMALFGEAYIWGSKRWGKPLAVVTSTGFFALMFLSAGLLAGPLSWPVLWASLYGGVSGGVIAVGASGEVKELGQRGEANLLRQLGTGFTEGVQTTSTKTWVFFLPMVGLQSLLLFEMAVFERSMFAVVVALVGSVGLFGYLWRLLRSGRYVREERMKVLGVGTAFSFVVLVLVLLPMLAWTVLLVLLVGMPGLWFLSNFFIWKTEGLSYRA